MGSIATGLVVAALPLLGAPRLTARIAANGSADLEIRIPRPPQESKEVAHSVLLEIGVANHGLTAVQHPLLNFCFPAGHRLRICDHRGEHLDKGRPLPPTAGDPPLDCWAIDDIRLRGRSDRLFHFLVRVDEPGAYPLKLRIRSRSLREELLVGGTLQVRQAEGDRSPEETISALIDQGEAIAGLTADVVSGSDLHREAGGFVLGTLVAVMELKRPDLRRRLDDALVDHAGPKMGDDYLRALVLSRVRALYDIRRQIG